MSVCYNKLIYWFCQLFVNDDASITCYLNLFKHLLSAQLQWIRIWGLLWAKIGSMNILKLQSVISVFSTSEKPTSSVNKEFVSLVPHCISFSLSLPLWLHSHNGLLLTAVSSPFRHLINYLQALAKDLQYNKTQYRTMKQCRRILSGTIQYTLQYTVQYGIIKRRTIHNENIKIQNTAN